MAAPALLISDLHLEESRPELTAGFLRFLDRRAGACSSLFILGDLFEAWIGDDDESALADSVAAGLHALSMSGVEVALMHGNRDFLIGEDFARRCGARLMAESEVFVSGSDGFLLMHGDSLCTDDTGYQQFRAQVRRPEWQAQFLAQPLDARRAFAAQARSQSRSETAAKSNAIMDVNDAAVLEAMRNAGVTQLIHGHTHRPATHRVTQLGGRAERTVLGDWGETGWCIALSDGDARLEEFTL